MPERNIWIENLPLFDSIIKQAGGSLTVSGSYTDNANDTIVTVKYSVYIPNDLWEKYERERKVKYNLDLPFKTFQKRKVQQGFQTYLQCKESIKKLGDSIYNPNDIEFANKRIDLARITSMRSLLDLFEEYVAYMQETTNLTD